MKIENLSRVTQLQARITDLTATLRMFETQTGGRTLINPVFICTRPKREPKHSDRLPENISDEVSERIREYINAEIRIAHAELSLQ